MLGGVLVGWMDGWREGGREGGIGWMDEWDTEDGLADVRVREAQERGLGCGYVQDGGHTEQARYKAMRMSASYKQCKARRLQVPRLAALAMRLAKQHDWPGKAQETKTGASVRGLVHVRACTSNTANTTWPMPRTWRALRERARRLLCMRYVAFQWWWPVAMQSG